MQQLLKRVVAAVLVWEAKAVLRRYRPKVVAVTGSVGKTSAKDAAYAVVSHGAYARKSDKSFNSEIGLPLTVLGLPNAWGSPLGWLKNFARGLWLIVHRVPYPEWLVLEVGADKPGDIQHVAQWLRADVVVVTRVPDVPVHVEFFASPEAVLAEKAALIDTLRPGGTLVLYADSSRTRSLADRAKTPVITFGFSEGTRVRCVEADFLQEGENGRVLGMRGALALDDSEVPVEVPGVVGAHALLPLVAGAAVGLALGKDVQAIAEALQKYEPPRGRMRLVPGIKHSTILDDTYNSSPAATAAALETLGAMPVAGRKIAVLGDMAELGRYSIEQHKKIGALAAKHADMVVAVGFRARGFAEGALDAGMEESAILQYEDARQAGADLQNIVKEGDCVLIKGSQSMRMERAAKELLAEPERATELLVRQDAAWEKR